MIAFFSSIAGILTAAIPEIIGMVKASADKKHALAVMEKQAELGLKQAQSEESKAIVDSATSAFEEAQKSYRAEIKAAEKSWVAAYSATVRPTITYLFFILYTAIKVKMCLYAIDTISAPALPWNVEAAVRMVWTDEDTAMFSWVVSFWFSSRILEKRK